MADIIITPEEHGNYRRPFSFHTDDDELKTVVIPPNENQQNTSLNKPGSPRPPEAKICKRDDTMTSLELAKLQNDCNGVNGLSHGDEPLLKQPRQRHKPRPKISQIEYCEKLAEKEANKNDEQSSAKPRPGLTTILTQINQGKLPAADTPIMTDVIAQGNMFRIRLPKVRDLQQFAEEMRGNKKFELLKTRPIRMELLERFVKKLTCDIETVKTERCEQTENEIEKRTEVDAVFKLYLNGALDSVDNFVSVCLSVVPRNEEQKNDDIIQNILEEEWLIVSVYLKQPNSDDNPYRRDFKMKFCSELEKEEKGLIKFIEKKKFDQYIADDGFVTIGVSILLGSYDTLPSKNNGQS